MKINLLLFSLLSIALNIFSQNPAAINEKQSEEKNTPMSLTVGLGFGGSSIAGADFEYLVYENLGLQAGVGLFGSSCGINYHLNKNIRSSFISLQYNYRGFGTDKKWGHKSSSIGPAFCYRGKKWLTFQLGIAYILDKGNAYDSVFDRDFPLSLNLGLGAYFPISNKSKAEK